MAHAYKFSLTPAHGKQKQENLKLGQPWLHGILSKTAKEVQIQAFQQLPKFLSSIQGTLRVKAEAARGEINEAHLAT